MGSLRQFASMIEHIHSAQALAEEPQTAPLVAAEAEPARRLLLEEEGTASA